MSAFRTSLVFQDNGGLPFTLASTFVYESTLLGHSIVVPSGFQTDLASIPRLFWRVLPPFGRYDHAAVIHDWLYHINGIPRVIADCVLREAMEVSGVSAWQRAVIYRAVRLGGWKPWNAYRRAEKK